MMPSTQEYEADICLVLEGTYPYVAGGVSSWVHSLIRGLDEFSFSLLLILPNRQERAMKYQLPANVKALHVMYLQDQQLFQKPFWPKLLSPQHLQAIWKMHQAMPYVREESYTTGGKHEFEEVVRQIHGVDWSPSGMLYAKRSWHLLLKLYEARQQNISFLDYFWTWRYLHAGVFGVMRQPIPLCRLYHSVSTGYAGLLAARARILTQRPLLVTEHGIYSKERKIEISRAGWIFEQSRERYRAEKRLGTFKQIWINAFRVMSRFCYDQASEIITLYTGNQRLQIEDGAALEKLRIIPNGVDFAKMSRLECQPQERPVIGFVGRIVSIKDVKTFLRAVKLVANRLPLVQAWLMGPMDEEQEYYEDCRQLVENLHLQEIVKFTGNVNLMEYYPKLSVMVLTSISEGQPLVILESQCLGIPVVATDVGSCRELLEGRTPEDQALGQSGFITGLADPEATAEAIIQILQDPELSARMGLAGQKRMQKFYDLPVFYQSYRALYRHYTQALTAGSERAPEELAL